MKLKAGRRVYVPSQKIFGTVVREGGILGLPASYAVVDDLGKKSVFFGDNIDNYLDKERLIDWLVRNEDWSGIGSYDNLVENYYVGGNEYYVFRS